MTQYATARHNMVEGQLRPNKITDDRVADALADIPREAFLPKDMHGIAYVDCDLKLEDGRHIMAPLLFARLLQEATIGESDLVLDIGCASGYSAAIIARLASTVVGLEQHEDLAGRAGKILSEFEIGNAAIVPGQHNEGYPAQGPYDVIVMEGRVPEVPAALLDQLAEGGRLVAVVGSGSVAEATLFVKEDNVISHHGFMEASTGELSGFEREEEFVF